MGTVMAQAITSLDGYAAKPDNSIGRLFDWRQNGEVRVRSPADADNRPFFGELSSEDFRLDSRTECMQGDRVLHVRFPVVKTAAAASAETQS